MDGTRFLFRSVCAALVLLPVQVPAFALDNANTLADLSLQELANLSVTSVSKKAQPLADAPAAIYVITNDAIRRSGARSLPEALRLAPNLEVAEANNNTWAISARGNNATTTDKLLVLIDGRIVYSPLFSGTFWDVQHVMLEDVDRIEVVAGPGGVLWGTNAVNGVINIITKSAADTQGGLVSGGGGRPGVDADLRYGGRLDGGGSYRVYGLVTDSYGTDRDTGTPMPDWTNTLQGGFRGDWTRGSQQLTLQGDAYGTNEQQALPADPARASGLNLLSHWDQALDGGSQVHVLGYYDHLRRSVPSSYSDLEDIGDIEFQHTLPEIASQDFIWGASYRYVMDDFMDVPNSGLLFIPAKANQSWTSLFGQDEAHLSADWRLIAGARIERNPYDGDQFLPNLRLVWQPEPTTLLWASASRAVRSPSRLDVQLFAPESGPPFSLVGNPDFQSEVMRIYEAGLRMQPSSSLSFAVNIFHDDSDNLRTEDVLSQAPSQIQLGNDMTWTTNGLTAWATWQPLQTWRLELGIMTLHESQSLAAGALPTSVGAEGDDPHNQWSLRSDWDLPHGLQLHLAVRHVGALPFQSVPAYTTGDLRLGWQWTRTLELSLLAENLFGPPHIEFGPTGTGQFGRGLYARLTWRP